VKRRQIDLYEQLALDGQALERALTYMKVAMPQPGNLQLVGRPSDASRYERLRDAVLTWFARPDVSRVFLALAIVTFLNVVAWGLVYCWACLGLFFRVDNGWATTDTGCRLLAAQFNQTLSPGDVPVPPGTDSSELTHTSDNAIHSIRSLFSLWRVVYSSVHCASVRAARGTDCTHNACAVHCICALSHCGVCTRECALCTWGVRYGSCVVKHVIRVHVVQ
jgi:hypothetical protein